MSEKTIDFPLPPIEALKFALKNCPFFHHSTKTLGQLRSLLKEDGDFLIQEGMLLSVRVYGQVMEFPIEIDNNKGHVQFTFSGCGFDSLEDFVLTFSKGGGKSFIQTRRGDQFQLVRPVLRDQYAGRFGYGECLNVRVGRNKECPSFVRALRTEFVSSVEELEQDLEKLIALEHRNLVRVCDFFLLRLPPSTSPLVFIRYDQIPEAKSLFDRLFNQKDVLSTRRYIKWAYQAAKGLNYLLDRGILHRRLNARACLLDKMENLRLSDFWTDNDPGDAQLFQRDLHLPHNIRQSAILYRDGWRYLAVETLINGQFDSTSQVWTFALLVWQIYTHCQFGNRIFYTTLAEFLSVTRGREPPYFMPGHLSPQEALQGMPEQRRRKMLFVRASANLPHSPDSLAQLIPKALLSERSQRPYFSELFRMVEAEKRILDAAHVLGYFL